MRRTFQRWIILALPLLLVAPSALASLPSSGLRLAEYQSQLAALPLSQNPDGAFGPLAYDANGTVLGTAPTAEALYATIMAVHLLTLEQVDPFANWTTHSGANTSLAASNVPNALGWLRSYENDPATAATPGQRALLALAYHRLGDSGNAARILHELLAAEAAAPGFLVHRDAAQTLFVLGRLPILTNATENATVLAFDARLAETHFTTFEGLSWGLLAQPGHTMRHDALVSALGADPSVGAATLALAAWGLASSAGPDADTEEALSEAHEVATQGLALTYRLLGERRAHPEFSPYADDAAASEVGSTDIPSGALGVPGMTGFIPDSTAPDAGPVAQDADGASGNRGFPIPTWLMGVILALALSAVVAFGLAYGLKRDDLSGIRRDIFEYIENHPGEHFSKIRRDLGLAPGTFQHHLSVLESDGWIASHKDARYKRYFVNGNRYQQIIAGLTYKQKFAALANATTRDFVRFIHENPGATQKMVAERLAIHASTVNWHANRLKQAGILTDERVGKEVRYTVDGDVVAKMLAPREDELSAAA